MRFLLALFALPLLAVTNSITISSQTGVTQSQRPYTIGRVFAQGEIANYAAPTISGTPLTSWQCDVRNRWPDGSLKMAQISYLLDTTVAPITITFQNNINPSSAGNAAATLAAADTQAQLLARTWQAEIDVTSGSTQAVSARSMLASVSSISTNPADTVTRYWLAGPVVTQVIVEDATTTRSFDITVNSSPLHPIFTLTDYPSYSAAHVDAVLENDWAGMARDATYSLAIKRGTGLATTQYTHSSFTHYVGQRWVERFWDGTAPGRVKIDHNLAYLVTTKAVPNFDLTRHPTSAAVTDEESGAQYLPFSGSDLYNGTDYTSYSYDPGDVGQVNAQMGAPGGWPYIGLTTRWQARWLYTGDPALEMISMGNADTAGSWPIHNRGGVGNASYLSNTAEPAQSTTAFGRWFSLDARPSDTSDMRNFANCGDGSGSACAQSALAPDTAHQVSLTYIPYLLTGDWYLYQELQAWAAWTLSNGDENYGNAYYARNFAMGIISLGNQERGRAWAFRALGDAAFTAIDGSAEYKYFREKLANNIGAWEGYENVTNGSYYDPSAGSPWTWGHSNMQGNYSGADKYDGPNPLNIPGATEEVPVSGHYDDAVDPAKAARGMSPWMENFLVAAVGFNYERGFDNGGLLKAIGQWQIRVVKDPASNPYLAFLYHAPAKQVATSAQQTARPGITDGGWFQTMWAWTGAFVSTAVTCTDSSTYHFATLNHLLPATCSYYFSDMTEPFTGVSRMAASFAAGAGVTAVLSDSSTATGLQAYNWIDSTIKTDANGFDSNYNEDTKWAIVPRAVVSSPSGSLSVSGRVQFSGRVVVH